MRCGVSGAERAVPSGAERCEWSGAVQGIVCGEMRWVRCRPGAGLPVVPEFLTP